MEEEYYRLFNNATTIYKSPPSSPRCPAKPKPRTVRLRKVRSPAEGFWRGGNLQTKVPGATKTSFYNARQQTWEHSNNLVHHYKNLARIQRLKHNPAVKKRKSRRKRGRVKRSHEKEKVELEVQTRQLAPCKPESLPKHHCSPGYKSRADAKYWSPTFSSAKKRRSKRKLTKGKRGVLPRLDNTQESSESYFGIKKCGLHPKGASAQQSAKKQESTLPSLNRKVEAFADFSPWPTQGSPTEGLTLPTVDQLSNHIRGGDLGSASGHIDENDYELDEFEQETSDDEEAHGSKHTISGKTKSLQSETAGVDPDGDDSPMVEEPVHNVQRYDDEGRVDNSTGGVNLPTMDEGSTLNTYKAIEQAQGVSKKAK